MYIGLSFPPVNIEKGVKEHNLVTLGKILSLSTCAVTGRWNYVNIFLSLSKYFFSLCFLKYFTFKTGLFTLKKKR